MSSLRFEARQFTAKWDDGKIVFFPSVISLKKKMSVLFVLNRLRRGKKNNRVSFESVSVQTNSAFSVPAGHALIFHQFLVSQYTKKVRDDKEKNFYGNKITSVSLRLWIARRHRHDVFWFKKIGGRILILYVAFPKKFGIYIYATVNGVWHECSYYAFLGK